MKPYTDEVLKSAYELLRKQDESAYLSYEQWIKRWEIGENIVSVDAVRAILEVMGYDPNVKEKKEIYVIFKSNGLGYVVEKDYPLAKCFVEK